MDVTEKQLEEIRSGRAVEIAIGHDEVVLMTKQLYDELRKWLDEGEEICKGLAEEVDPSFFECEELES